METTRANDTTKQFDRLAARLARTDLDDDQLVEAAHALGDLGEPRGAPILIRLLDTANSSAVRNAAAIGLRELRDNRALPALLRQITDPRNAADRGTFIYALETLDARPALLELAHAMCQGHYEVMAMALRVIEDLPGPLPLAVKQEAMETLRLCLHERTHEPWRREMLARALEHLDSHPVE